MSDNLRTTLYKRAYMGMGAAVAAGYLFKRNLPSLMPAFPQDLSDSERLMFVFRCLTFSALPFVGALQNVLRFRGKHIETLGANPIGPVAPSLTGFRIAERVLQNTVEQTILHVFAVLALTSCVSVDQLYFIPGLVILFNVGRLAFGVGYHISPLYRGFGYAMTFFPSVFGIGYSIFTIASGAFSG